MNTIYRYNISPSGDARHLSPSTDAESFNPVNAWREWEQQCQIEERYSQGGLALEEAFELDIHDCSVIEIHR